MIDKIYIVQKRKLSIKEVFVDKSTAVFVKDIGRSVFFDRASAEEKLEWLIDEYGTKIKKETHKKYFSPEDVRRMSPIDVRDNYKAICESMKKWK